ncbi:MAG: hypothetical protein LBL46_01675 [Rickettsiales bacterium]|nr:hypothetical protein [Rickettsiales bacterium]
MNGARIPAARFANPTQVKKVQFAKCKLQLNFALCKLHFINTHPAFSSRRISRGPTGKHRTPSVAI